jgi:hypothetical protein
MEFIMSLEEGFNIVDNALNLAVADLEGRGMPKDEAQIALLIRLWNVVPEDVAEIADMLRKDSDLASAINGAAEHDARAAQTA